MTRNVKVGLAALGALLLGLVAAWALLREAPDEAKPQVSQPPSSHPLAFRAGPTPQERDDENTLPVRLGAAGPEVVLAPDRTVALTPIPEGVTLAWRSERAADTVQFIGEGELRGRPLEMRWVFAEGNAQAVLSMHARGLPGSVLSEAIEAQVVLPPGDVRYVDPSLRQQPFVGKAVGLDPWTPGWLNWRGGGRTLTIDQWWFDRVELSEGGATATRLNFRLWDPEQRGLGECALPEDLVIDLDARMMVTFSERLAAVPSRVPHANRAALVPIFDDPAHVEDARFRDVAPANAEDFTRRARTLAFGHSSPSDPRYGNGGLLGSNLGGTIVRRAGLSGPKSARLHEEVSQTPVEIAGGIEADGPTALLAGGCEELVEGLRSAKKTLVVDGPTYDGRYHNTLRARDKAASRVPALAPQLPTIVRPLRLDGHREPLVTQALSKLYLERLVRERGLMFVRAPLVATRNPLIPAAHEALLVPEREGQWTLAPPLVHALTEIELMREEHPLAVMGVGGLVDFWRQARKVELWHGADGSLEVTHHGDTPLRDFTLIVSGALDPAVDGAAVHSVVTDADSTAPQTWLSWTLEPSTTHVVRFTTADGLPAPSPVRWRFENGEGEAGARPSDDG